MIDHKKLQRIVYAADENSIIHYLWEEILTLRHRVEELELELNKSTPHPWDESEEDLNNWIEAGYTGGHR